MSINNMLQRVTIVRPGGNDTVIVWDNIPRKDQGAVSLSIQRSYPDIEQVMFVEPGQATRFRGQMAGGEFCGNATRSLGYLLLEEKDGSIDLEVSGSNSIMSVVVKDKFSQTTAPILNSLESVSQVNGTDIVHLDGISFIITSSQQEIGLQIDKLRDTEDKKKKVKDILDGYGFSNRFPACGVMIADKKDDGTIQLQPFVYVRDTQTLYFETGCGSGSIAVGMVLAKSAGQTIRDLKIIQPSGMDLFVTIDRNEKEFTGASVNGPVEVISDGKMPLSNDQESSNSI